MAIYVVLPFGPKTSDNSREIYYNLIRTFLKRNDAEDYALTIRDPGDFEIVLTYLNYGDVFSAFKSTPQ